MNVTHEFHGNKFFVKKVDTAKNWPIVKNLQFLSNPHENWPE